MRESKWIIVGLGFCVLALTGCPNKVPTEAGKSGDVGTSSSPTSARDRSVRITSVTPDADTPLRAGSTVKLSVAVEYAVPSMGGTVGLVVQDSNNASIKSSLKEVPGGSGSVTSEVEFVVPNTKHIDVHVPLYVKGENKSTQVAVKKFLITPK